MLCLIIALPVIHTAAFFYFISFLPGSNLAEAQLNMMFAMRARPYSGWPSAAGCNEDEWMRPRPAGARPGVVLALEKQAPLGLAVRDK